MVIKAMVKAAVLAPKVKKAAQKIDRALPKVAKGTAKAMENAAFNKMSKAQNKWLETNPYTDKNGKKRWPIEQKIMKWVEKKAGKDYVKAGIDYEKVQRLARKLSKMFD